MPPPQLLAGMRRPYPSANFVAAKTSLSAVPPRPANASVVVASSGETTLRSERLELFIPNGCVVPAHRLLVDHELADGERPVLEAGTKETEAHYLDKSQAANSAWRLC